jgi:predicted metal-dependent hydrolase
VYPPTGRVRISAPMRMNIDTIRLYAISKLGWIKQQQGKLQKQERETPREYLERESHYVWGRRYLLMIQPHHAAPEVELDHSRLVLRIRPDATTAQKAGALSAWYRGELRAAAEPRIEVWQGRLSVSLDRLIVQRMRTLWGSCTPASRTIRLNTELAQKPRECLDYIVVHELAHLVVPTHDARFIALLDQTLPNWRRLRQTLNGLPLGHLDWAN